MFRAPTIAAASRTASRGNAIAVAVAGEKTRWAAVTPGAIPPARCVYPPRLLRLAAAMAFVMALKVAAIAQSTVAPRNPQSQPELPVVTAWTTIATVWPIVPTRIVRTMPFVWHAITTAFASRVKIAMPARTIARANRPGNLGTASAAATDSSRAPKAMAASATVIRRQTEPPA